MGLSETILDLILSNSEQMAVPLTLSLEDHMHFHKLFVVAVVCLLIGTVSAEPLRNATLKLEFAQEGEPSQPRALIIIHDALNSRESLALFLQTWSARDYSWARSHYCSVYTYEYEESGLEDLARAEDLASDLLSRVNRNRVRLASPDEINPKPQLRPRVGMQPLPSFKRDNVEFLVAGVGYGGLVARHFAVQAKAEKKKVSRLAFVSTPLDGLSTVELFLAFSKGTLSPAWLDLASLHQENERHRAELENGLAGTVVMSAEGVVERSRRSVDNVLYGRSLPVSPSAPSGNGLFKHLSMLGLGTATLPDQSQITVQDVPQGALPESLTNFLITKLVDQKITFDYLWRRQQIEDYVRGDGDIEPLYIYWDERDNKYTIPMWREAYASRRGLYEWMWF